jgi:hypothetical protein
VLLKKIVVHIRCGPPTWSACEPARRVASHVIGMSAVSSAAVTVPHAHVGALQNCVQHCVRMRVWQKRCHCGRGSGPLAPSAGSQQRDAVGRRRLALTPAPAATRYQRYADLKGWKVQRVNENIMEGGGYKECVLQVPQRQFSTVD